MKKQTFFTYSFGCRVNQAEKEVIDLEMQKVGFSYEKKTPNILIINTCSITHKAEREAKQLIYKLRRDNPKGKIVITGCSATYWKKKDYLKNLPVDLVVDNLNKEFLVKIIHKRYFSQAKHNLGGYVSGGRNKLKTIIGDKYLNSGRVLIKIQDGCQRFCTYCIVPYLRGIPKSDQIKNIISRIISHEGKVNEAILTAINTEAYGFDTGETFVNLIDTIVKNTKIPRISFGSLHPWSINKDFLKFYQTILPLKRVVNFFHVPIQSGSNKILKLMKRDYTKEEIMWKLNQIHKSNPKALIATDIIVGFMDESEKDFQETVDFLKESPIAKFHIFRFSKRDNTSAYYMGKYLHEPTNEVKLMRSKVLSDLGKKKYEEFLRRNVGRTSTVLLLNTEYDGYREGLLDNQLPIYVKTEKSIQLTQLYEAKILEYKNGRLFGIIMQEGA